MSNQKTHDHPRLHARVKEKLDRAIFHVTLASSFVAVVAALAALWSGYEAHKTRVDDERPFLAVDVAPPGSKEAVVPGTFLSPTLRTHVVAFGKSPSRKIIVTCAQIRVSDLKSATWKWEPSKAYSTAAFPFLLPGRSAEIACAMLPSSGNGSVPAQFEFAVVQYEDEAQRAYQTPFCFGIVELAGTPPIVQPCVGSHGLPDLR